MQTIIAADIHGVTPRLKAMLSVLGEEAVFLSPWPTDACPYTSEEEAVGEFLAQRGIESYAEKIADAVGGSAAFLVGFSVGASSTWLYTGSHCCHRETAAYVFYGSRIRSLLDVAPRCAVHAIFAQHEASFEPLDVVERIKGRTVEAMVVAKTRHGFMNPDSPHFSAAHASYHIDRLAKAQATLRQKLATHQDKP